GPTGLASLSGNERPTPLSESWREFDDREESTAGHEICFRGSRDLGLDSRTLSLPAFPASINVHLPLGEPVMPDRVNFRCPHCRAKLRAAFRLLGSACPCPKCKGEIVVRVTVPSDADIVLVGPR